MHGEPATVCVDEGCPGCHSSTSKDTQKKSWPVCPGCQFEIDPAHPYHQADCPLKKTKNFYSFTPEPKGPKLEFKDTQSTEKHYAKQCWCGGDFGVCSFAAPPPTGAQEGWDETTFNEMWYAALQNSKPGFLFEMRQFINKQITAAEERGAQKADWWGEKLEDARKSGFESGKQEGKNTLDQDDIDNISYEAGALAHHKRVVEMMPEESILDPKEFPIGKFAATHDEKDGWNACRSAMLAALTTIDPEKKE